jgi:hypothetical protein
MTTNQQRASTDATRDRGRGMTIHMAGGGLFVVMDGHREMFRGTFVQCYDYVNSADWIRRC